MPKNPAVGKMPVKGQKHVLASRKRARIVSSDDETVILDSKPSGSNTETISYTKRKSSTKKGSSESDARTPSELRQSNKGEMERTLSELRQSNKKGEMERKKLVARLNAKKEQLKETQTKLADQTRALDKAKKDKQRQKRNMEQLEKDKQEIETSSKRFKKKMENYRSQFREAEDEKAKLESRLANLQLNQDGGSSASGSSGRSTGASGGESNLFQDILDNFRELAENQLMCVVCSEVFVNAVSINCGHTFCDYCITEWKKKKNNCPVCRANIKSTNPVKVLDEYSDKVYEQFVPEGVKQSRATLKEERYKLQKEAEKNKKKSKRGLDRILDVEDDSGDSIDSDETLEIRYNSDFDSDVSDEIWRFNPSLVSDSGGSSIPDSDILFAMPPRIRTPILSSLQHFFDRPNDLENTDTDDSSDDEDFNVQRWTHQRRQLDTSSSSSNSNTYDSISESSSSSSSSDSSDSSDQADSN